MAGHVEEQQVAERSEPDRYDSDHHGSVEARVLRKLDWNIMPLFFVLCEHEKPLLLLRHNGKIVFSFALMLEESPKSMNGIANEHTAKSQICWHSWTEATLAMPKWPECERT